ncbi:hypothetical protein ACH5RR_001145 [Cinchona calisaya]|uniref:Uncharacterized protein n=1 Tax=Cinchona calisaya TaxID=153742 RepID=A0ABD3B2P6_9GENT
MKFEDSMSGDSKIWVRLELLGLTTADNSMVPTLVVDSKDSNKNQNLAIEDAAKASAKESRKDDSHTMTIEAGQRAVAMGSPPENITHSPLVSTDALNESIITGNLDKLKEADVITPMQIMQNPSVHMGFSTEQGGFPEYLK